MTEPTNDPPSGGSRWTDRADVPRGDDYDARFERLAASGADVHGEADLVSSLAPGGRVLDAGCGTGRVAIELARRNVGNRRDVDLTTARVEDLQAQLIGAQYELDSTVVRAPSRGCKPIV